MDSFLLTEEQLREGIKVCLEKVKKLLDDAFLLINDQFALAHALGMYTFAVEEYGKALLLKDCLPKETTDGKFTVPKWILGYDGSASHRRKFEMAISNLPEDCKNLDIGFVFEGKDTYLLKIGNGEKGHRLQQGEHGLEAFLKPIDFDVRKRCFYVDWKQEKEQWLFEVGVEKEVLTKAIIQFKLHLKKIQT